MDCRVKPGNDELEVSFMPIRLMENFRAVFYAPYYATHALGFYKREGVDVELLTSDAPGDAVPKLIDGTIDVTWGGPMRVMRAHDQDKHSPLVSFCEVVSHDPFFLIGKPGPFRLADLPAKRFASVSEVPTPWMCLQQDLRDQGIDPDKLPRISDRTMTRNYDALKAGDIDIMQAFEPFVSMAEKDGAGGILYAASTRGPTAYTAFIATRDACAKHRDEFAAMTRATGEDAGLALRQSSRGACRSGGVLLPRCAEGHPGELAAPLQRRRPLVPRDPDDPARLRPARAKPAFRWIHRPHAGL